MPCSCCKGALTFDEARLVKEKLAGDRATPNTKDRDFRAVPATTCWGIENCKELFGLGNDKEAISAAFDAGSGTNKKNLLFGSNGLVSRTLDHWERLLDDAFKLIESLRAELFKSRAETEKALREKKNAEQESLHATLKLEQTQVRLDGAQKALEAMAKDRRERAVQGAFDTAENDHQMRTVKRSISAALLSRSPGKTQMERLKARRRPLQPTGLTRSRVVRATDGGGLHRSTCMRRRNYMTLPMLNNFVASAGPVHLPRESCPPESDTKAHTDYKAKVRVQPPPPRAR